MAILLPPHMLKNPDHPPIHELVNGVENMCAEYFLTWQKFPRYLYVNTGLWQELHEALEETLRVFSLSVIYCDEMPYDRLSVHFEEHDCRSLGLWQQGFTDEEGEETGKIAVV